MSKQINLNDNNWIDIVFENRNHEYGAYDIRKNYNKNSMLGVLGMFSFLGLAFGGILLFSSFKSTPPIPEVDPPLYDTIIIVMPDLPPLEEEEEIVEYCPNNEELELKLMGQEMSGGFAKFSAMTQEQKKEVLKKRSRAHFQKEIKEKSKSSRCCSSVILDFSF